ncbi:hypothetical protein BD413DRAFT_613515 [Trametes elegans]|nr:hypothetical protein BD413DRAFT_613515 [Trametes elegans]
MAAPYTIQNVDNIDEATKRLEAQTRLVREMTDALPEQFSSSPSASTVVQARPPRQRRAGSSALVKARHPKGSNAPRPCRPLLIPKRANGDASDEDCVPNEAIWPTVQRWRTPFDNSFNPRGRYVPHHAFTTGDRVLVRVDRGGKGLASWQHAVVPNIWDHLSGFRFESPEWYYPAQYTEHGKTVVSWFCPERCEILYDRLLNSKPELAAL